MNIEQFCFPPDTDCRYPGARVPFRIGKWIYATDGRICVRVPRLPTGKAKPIKVKPTAVVPKANKLFLRFRAIRCNAEWPSAAGVKLAESVLGKVTIPPQTVGNRTIGGGYWFHISQLGRVRFNPQGKPGDGLQFVCGKLQGIIMPRLDEE